MKRTFAVFAVLLLGTSAFAADSRTIKRDLIRELLNVIDAKALTQSMFDIAFPANQAPDDVLKSMPEEQRKSYEAQQAIQKQKIAVFRERLLARIDYVKFADEVYAPVFDKAFTAQQLTELIAFYRTPVGRKSAQLLPELAMGSLLKGSEELQELTSSIQSEIQQEDLSANPWKRTMTDLRTVATAAEAYATDQNKYPNVSSYEELGKILSPTYILKMPEKDGWGTPYRYAVSSDGLSYRFISAGADKRFEWNSDQFEPAGAKVEGRAMESLDADIIFQNGMFVQFPAVAPPDQQ